MGKKAERWYAVAQERAVELRMKEVELQNLRETNKKLVQRLCGIKLR